MDEETPVTRRVPRSASTARSLQRLRLRVTAWYVGTFGVVLLALGGLLFAALTRDVSADLDSSLRAATHEVALAAARRERERAATGGGAIDAVDELRIPDRQLYLFDLAGHPLTPPHADTLLQQLAQRAGAEGSSVKRWDALRDQSLQAFAESFTTRGGATFVAIAVANRDLTDERSRALLALLGGLGGLGLILVATGGWLLARQSVAPVEHSMLQMQRFMADAAHELRTPVAVMRSRVDVTLEQSRDQASYRRALAELREEIERVGALVNDLFTLANADSEARPFSGVPVQLDEIVLETVSTAGWIAARRSITLVVEEADEVVIEGDAVLLRQLGMILLDNAIKFSDQGGFVKIGVRAEAHGAVFVVEDQGVGIAAADVERVFDRFYRAESVRASTAGAGLGLAIARWITDSHRAHIALEPAPKRGTRVTVTFPALDQRTPIDS